jgi:ABC-2 type transport system ATP-binding protein
MDRGTDRITIGLTDPPSAAPEISLAGIHDLTMDDGQLVVTAARGSAVVPDLLAELQERGLEVTDLDIERASLEEVFVDMTRKESAVGA